MKTVIYKGHTVVRFFWNGFGITLKHGVYQIQHDKFADELVHRGYCEFYTGSDPIIGSEDEEQPGYDCGCDDDPGTGSGSNPPNDQYPDPSQWLIQL